MDIKLLQKSDSIFTIKELKDKAESINRINIDHDGDGKLI